MRDASETAWWRKTWQLAAAAAGGATILALLAVTVDGQAGPSIFGLPLGEFFAVVVVPLVLLIAVFVFTNRQRALDRRYDVAED